MPQLRGGTRLGGHAQPSRRTTTRRSQILGSGKHVQSRFCWPSSFRGRSPRSPFERVHARERPHAEPIKSKLVISQRIETQFGVHGCGIGPTPRMTTEKLNFLS